METASGVNAFERHKGHGKIADESTHSEKNGAKKDSVDITALIRSVQRTEGNPDCFRRSEGYCGQMDCAWRPYCLEDLATPGS